MQPMEILIAGLWAVAASSSNPRPEQADSVDLLSPGGHHSPRLTFFTHQLQVKKDVDASLIIDPRGRGLGVVDLNQQEVTFDLDGAGSRQVTMSWARDPQQERPGQNESHFMDWIPGGAALGTTLKPPSQRGKAAACRCELPGGELLAERLFTGGLTPPPVWEYAAGSPKAIADRLLLKAQAASRVRVVIGGGLLQLQGEGDPAVYLMLSGDTPRVEHVGRQPVLGFPHLKHLEPLCQGPITVPEAARGLDLRSDMPICPQAFFA